MIQTKTQKTGQKTRQVWLGQRASLGSLRQPWPRHQDKHSLARPLRESVQSRREAARPPGRSASKLGRGGQHGPAHADSNSDCPHHGYRRLPGPREWVELGGPFHLPRVWQTAWALGPGLPTPTTHWSRGGFGRARPGWPARPTPDRGAINSQVCTRASVTATAPPTSVPGGS